MFCTAVWSVVGIAPTISLCRSTNSNAKPPDACHAMWQWVSQVPGLSSLKAMARYCYSIRQQLFSMGNISRICWGVTHAVAGECRHVPARRVGGGDVGGGRVERPGVLGDDPEVVPVEVNRMEQAEAGTILDDD